MPNPIAERTHPALRHLIAPGTLLSDLGFVEEIDLVGLQCQVEECIGMELPEHDYASWRTVADVLYRLENYPCIA